VCGWGGWGWGDERDSTALRRVCTRGVGYLAFVREANSIGAGRWWITAV